MKPVSVVAHFAGAMLPIIGLTGILAFDVITFVGHWRAVGGPSTPPKPWKGKESG
jgi:hypothetical protein